MNAIRPLMLALPTSPLTDADTGEVRPEWRRFFLGLVARTGGGAGVSVEQLQAELDAEEAARAAGDQALTVGLGLETSARIAGDSANAAAIQAEARQRAATDGELRYLFGAGDAQNAAAMADLVPKNQLCSLWAACDLSFLPVADPGHGQPWLNGGTMTVGTPAGVVSHVGLEDGSGVWLLEAGNDWVWG